MIKVNFTPKTDIEEYLSMDKNNHLYAYNYELYIRLTEDDELKEQFNPLEFFNLLYENIEIVEANKQKPHIVINYLLNLFTDKFKLIVFLTNLNILSIYKNYIYKTGKAADDGVALFNKYLFEEIEKLVKEQLGEFYKPDPMKYLYKFEYIRRELEHFQTKNEKIYYLIEVMTIVLQMLEKIGPKKNTPIIEKNFINKCKLEIQKLKELSDLEEMAEKESIQHIPRENSQKLFSEDLLHKKNIIKEAPPKNFIEIFNNDNFTKYIDVLIECEPQLLIKENERYTFVGNKNTQVSCVAYWFKELKNKGIIKQTVNRNDIARVLNNEIKNYSICGSSIDNKTETYKRIFEKQFDKIKREIT